MKKKVDYMKTGIIEEIGFFSKEPSNDAQEKEEAQEEKQNENSIINIKKRTKSDKDQKELYEALIDDPPYTLTKK